MKFRIIQNDNGRTKVQRKYFGLIWLDVFAYATGLCLSDYWYDLKVRDLELIVKTTYGPKPKKINNIMKEFNV